MPRTASGGTGAGHPRHGTPGGRAWKRREPVSEVKCMECRIPQCGDNWLYLQSGKTFSYVLPSLTPFGPLGGEVNGQCVPVRGVRSDPVASDRPESNMLNQWWPDTAGRQSPPAGSQSGHYVSRCLRSGRS